jgi:hypothetical protein
MSKIDQSELDRQFEQVEQKLPDAMARFVRWLRQPSSRWVRIPAAFLLIMAGFVGFLPILGFWMIPLGLLLVAQDIPFLRGPIARLLAWSVARLDAWKRPPRATQAPPPPASHDKER